MILNRPILIKLNITISIAWLCLFFKAHSQESPIDQFEINSNFYSRLSGDKTVGSTTERAMDGIDAEIGFQIPYMPNSKLFFQGYEWEGSDYDIDSGNKISLRLRPSSSLQIEIGAEDNNRQSDYKATASVTFTKTFGKVERNSGMYISEELFEFQDPYYCRHSSINKDVH